MKRRNIEMMIKYEGKVGIILNYYVGTMLSEPKGTGTIRKEGNTIAGVSWRLISFNVSLIDRNKKIFGCLMRD
jgi:hypothetical protein